MKKIVRFEVPAEGYSDITVRQHDADPTRLILKQDSDEVHFGLEAAADLHTALGEMLQHVEAEVGRT